MGGPPPPPAVAKPKQIIIACSLWEKASSQTWQASGHSGCDAAFRAEEPLSWNQVQVGYGMAGYTVFIFQLPGRALVFSRYSGHHCSHVE